MKRDLIKQELETLAEANDGLLKAEAVVEFAKDPATALHSRFTWDDTEAAAEYRLIQARHLIRYVYNVAEVGAPEPVRFNTFVSLRDDRYNGGGYRLMFDVMSDEEQRQRLLEEAHRDFLAWKAKYQHLKELVPVFEKMAEVATSNNLVLVAKTN